MKNLFITTVFVLTTMLTFAQGSEHLSFKGVPIDGTRSEFVSKMVQKGFTHGGTENEISILTGEFAGYRDCTISVATLKKKDLVNTIIVIFSSLDTWELLSNNYFNLKDLLTQKYGKPAEVVERFDDYPEPEDDDSKMFCVMTNKCKYYSTFETEKGTIELSIIYDESMNSYVTLKYCDKINREIIRTEALDDL